MDKRQPDPSVCMDCPDVPLVQENPTCGCCLPYMRDTTLDYYMVTDGLWNSLTKDQSRGQLHLACLEKRLGRPLVLEDFPKFIPVNDWLHERGFVVAP